MVLHPVRVQALLRVASSRLHTSCRPHLLSTAPTTRPAVAGLPHALRPAAWASPTPALPSGLYRSPLQPALQRFCTLKMPAIVSCTPLDKKAYSSGSSATWGRNEGRNEGQQHSSNSNGGGSHQHSTFSFSFSGAHVACYGAMLVISLPALGKTLVVLCDGKTPATVPTRRVTAQLLQDSEESQPATLADLFSILEGEWAWLGLAIAVTLLWAWCMNSMPVVWAALTQAVQKKEPMDGPIFNFIKLQVRNMVNQACAWLAGGACGSGSSW